MDLNKLYQAKIFCSYTLIVQVVLSVVFLVVSIINAEPVYPGEAVFIKTPDVLDYLFWITVFFYIFIWLLIKIQERKERQIKDNLPIDRV
jgi:hypothetical protein